MSALFEWQSVRFTHRFTHSFSANTVGPAFALFPDVSRWRGGTGHLTKEG